MNERGLTHSKSSRRMHKIRHDDHEDYLVHDVTTDDLHLEHPCDTCGDNDVHGKFRLVGKRRLQGNDRMQLHFFEVAQKPFRILDYITGLFEFDLNADRVLAARPSCSHDHDHGHEHSHGHSHAFMHTFVPPKKNPCCQAGTCSAATSIADDICTILPGGGNSVRSSFMCKKICCASEIPMINKVLEPVLGVQRILINVPVKMVIVDHDPDVVSSKDIETILNKNHFGAQIKTAGAGTLATGSTCGRSQFFVQKICCASEIPAINTIVEPIPGVSKVSINVTTKMVYVDHDTASVSATDICDALNADHFGAHIRHDAADDVRAPVSAFVSSKLSFTSSDTSSPDTESLKEFLGTFDPMQIEAFVVDVPLKKITVVHNPHILSAETIVKMLAEDTGIKAIIIVNGAQSANWKFPEVREEQETMDKYESWPRISTILSGVFWIISMLSLIGGNWYVSTHRSFSLLS
jgi:copper chaperone CopZ